MTLVLTPNFDDGDGFYEQLITAHDGLSDEQSSALNARLIFILANHIGSNAILEEALQVAVQSAQPAQSPPNKSDK